MKGFWGVEALQQLRALVGWALCNDHHPASGVQKQEVDNGGGEEVKQFAIIWLKWDGQHVHGS